MPGSCLPARPRTRTEKYFSHPLLFRRRCCSLRSGSVILFPLAIQLNPFLRCDLPLPPIKNECEFVLRFAHQDVWTGGLPAFAQRCGYVAPIEHLDTNVLDVADDQSSIFRIIQLSGSAHTGTRDAFIREITAELWSVESREVVDVRTLFRIDPLTQECADLPLRLSRDKRIFFRTRDLHHRVGRSGRRR